MRIVFRKSPYKGLVPYDEEDADFFFGRDKDTQLIIANLFAARLTLLYGASGVGKTSVLRAGVLRELRTRKDVVVSIFSAWQGEPTIALKKVISAAITMVTGATIVSSDYQSLQEYLVTCKMHLRNKRFMILMDQFEDYFLYHSQDDDIQPFLTEFPNAINDSDLPVNFLLSLREDTLAKLDRFEGRIPILFDNYLRLNYLDRSSAAEAIVKPIDRYNSIGSPAGQSFGIEVPLVENVLDQVKIGRAYLGNSGWSTLVSGASPIASGNRIEPAFLQIVMSRLWEEEARSSSRVLRLETLNRLGGANRILRTHVDVLMNALVPDDRDIASSVFHYLVTPTGHKIAHTATDLANYTDVSEQRLVSLLSQLSTQSFRVLRSINAFDDPTIKRYEIFHDVLAPAILEWRARYLVRKSELQARERAYKIVKYTLAFGIPSLVLILAIPVFFGSVFFETMLWLVGQILKNFLQVK